MTTTMRNGITMAVGMLMLMPVPVPMPNNQLPKDPKTTTSTTAASHKMTTMTCTAMVKVLDKMLLQLGRMTMTWMGKKLTPTMKPFEADRYDKNTPNYNPNYNSDPNGSN